MKYILVNPLSNNSRGEEALDKVLELVQEELEVLKITNINLVDFVSKLSSSDEIDSKVIETSKEIGKEITVGTIHSSDVFYKENDNFREIYEKYGCLGCEMESFALFHNASVLGKKAACLLTVSNNLVTNAETTSEERQNAFNDMMEIALESAIKL